MSAVAALLHGIAHHLQPPPVPADSYDEKPARFNRYREQLVQANMPTLLRHGLSEEGAYLVATNPTVDTGQTWVAAQTSFSDTAPNFYIYNPETSNTQGRSIYLDYLKMMATAVATAAATVRFAVILDQSIRSPTTDNTQLITPVNPNGNTNNLITPVIKAQNSTTASVLPASSAAKRVVAQGCLGGLPAIGDEKIILFGNPDVGFSSGLTAAQATAPAHTVSGCSPVIIGPGQSCAIHIWMPSSSASFNPTWEMGMFLR